MDYCIFISKSDCKIFNKACLGKSGHRIIPVVYFVSPVFDVHNGMFVY